MARNRPSALVLRHLADLPIPKKLALLIAIPFCVVLPLLALAVGGFEAQSGIRAYIGEEGLYSDAQENAVNHLDRYALSGDPREYQQFERYIAVPLGDQAARRELEKPQYDYAAAAGAFEQGRNHPADIQMMIVVFRWGRHISYVDRAIAIWAQADGKVNALRGVAGDLHREIASGHPARARVSQLLGQSAVINGELSRLEIDFSFALGEAARWLKSTLLEIMLLAMLLFSVLSIGLARAIAKQLTGEIDHLKLATARVAQGDFSQPIEVESRDEIGQLAAQFGEMTTQRKAAEDALAQRLTELGESRINLAENHRRLEEAQEISHIGSWEWDIAADTITWSDELYRIYSASPESFDPSYEAHLQRVHPDDREAMDASVRRAMKAHEPFAFEHRIIHPDGTIRLIHAKGHVIVNDSGEIVRMLGTGQDMTERKEAELHLLHLAHFDSLTALPNRTLFYASLRDALARAAAQQWIVSVLFLDIDHFKDVNDTMGHACGDELLRQVGNRLVLSLRVRDTVGRLGGDEFAVVLMSSDNPHSVAIVANKLRDALRQPFNLEGREVTVTVSIGVTMFPADSTDAETLINYADTAMYAAKEAGRDTYRFYTAAMNADAEHRLGLDNALRRALDHDEFELHYQPKIELASGRWTGVEALLRWNRPGHGLVLPGEFVPLLEETGLIEPVGIWVINAACQQIAAWIAEGIGTVPIAVNVSVKQLLHGRLAHEATAQGTQSVAALIESPALELAVERALRENDIATDLLGIELTESTLMLHAAKTVGLLQRLKSLGIQISVDDFGTGYSSLAYLKRFPINTVKIDQTFIRDITANPDDAAIAVAIINLAHSLKLKVVAEGVETREQLDFLCAKDCDEAQGYYIARPMAADAVAELFRTSGGRLAMAGSASIRSIADGRGSRSLT